MTAPEPALCSLDRLLADVPDPELCVPSAEMERALAAVEDALRAGEQAVLIAGPAGFGKTLLLRVLGARAPAPGDFAYVPFLALPAAEAARWLLGLLGEHTSGERTDESALLARWKARREAGGHTILLVDEAQAIPAETAERLSDLARHAGDAIQLVLAGIDSLALDAVLARFPVQPLCVPLRLPLTENDVERTITHMLEIASEDHETAAVAWLGGLDGADLLRASGGVPRLLRSEMLRRWLRLGDPAVVEPATRAERTEGVEPDAGNEGAGPAESTAGDDRVAEVEPQERLLELDSRQSAPLVRPVAEPVLLSRAGAVSEPALDRAGVLARRAGAWLLGAPGALCLRARERSRSVASRSRGLAFAVVGFATVGLGVFILRADEPRPGLDAPRLAVSVPDVAAGPALAPPAPARSEPGGAPGGTVEPAAAVAADAVLVNVNAVPWARIRVDGRELGATPLGNIPLDPGTHRFEAAMSDGRVLRRVVTIGSEERLVSFR